MKTLILILIGVVLLSLVVFTIVRNNIDRKKFERNLTNDDRPNEHEEAGEIKDDDATKSTT